MASLVYRAPPPSYGIVASETRPLFHKKRRDNKITLVTLFVTAFVLVLLIGTLTGGLIGQVVERDDPATWDRLRLQYRTDRELWEKERVRWERERNEHRIEVDQWDRDRHQLHADRVEFDKRWSAFKQQEYNLQQQIESSNRQRLELQKEKDLLSKEKGANELTKLSMDKDRASWARERDQWEHERNQHHDGPSVYPFEAHWEKPVPGQCHSYGKREYSARLWDIPFTWDWIEACEVTPVKLRGLSINKTDRCENRGFWGGVVGYWLVDVNEPLCEPSFDVKQDLGCVNQGSGIRRFEAQVLGIQQSDDWVTMCSITPTTIDGTEYSGPTYCTNKVHRDQKVAVWDHPDPTC